MFALGCGQDPVAKTTPQLPLAAAPACNVDQAELTKLVRHAHEKGCLEMLQTLQALGFPASNVDAAMQGCEQRALAAGREIAAP